ncbi:MAG TPA: alpha/beta fold hydrolase [Rhodothermales bacterium]|nr:alpha/beta fold hydrolase [Rhodothermales bacterium]
MAFSLSKLAQNLLKRTNGDRSSTSARTTTLVTGSVAVGALVTGAVLEKTRRNRLPRPDQLPKALEADVQEIEIMEGRVRYYKRGGNGVPIVLLHSVNAAASSFEMKPIFEHLKAHTDRPLYALDLLGFGLSDRPAARYSPGLYQRELRRFLSERVMEAADVIALSLSCEYAATVANAFPFLVNRMVFISPTGLGAHPQESVLQRAVVGAASTVGAFEIFFARLTQRSSLRSFYAEHVFLKPDHVPSALVDYAYVTSHAKGAHYAPRRFIQGVLSMHGYAPPVYAGIRQPTLFVIPQADSEMVQDFVRAPVIAAENEAYIQLRHVDAGLLPQWEAPEALFEVIDPFIGVAEQLTVSS